MNGYTGLLDKALHTYEYVRSTSFFLLSVTIQAAAGRDLNPVSQARSAYIARTILQHIKDTIWPMVLLRNMRSVQICQACMIWTTFTDSKDITDEEPSWFLFGHARKSFSNRSSWVESNSSMSIVRIAVELGLSRELKHSESHDSHSKAVLRDAQRCWMTCWIADRSWSAQSARPALIPENETTLDAQNWLIQTQANADDASIVALIQLRRILERLPDNAQLADRKVRSNTDLIQRDLEVWKRTWSAGTYHSMHDSIINVWVSLSPPTSLLKAWPDDVRISSICKLLTARKKISPKCVGRGERSFRVCCRDDNSRCGEREW